MIAMEMKQQTIEELNKYGLREDKHFYIENVLMVETYFQARAVNIVSESDYGDDNYDARDKAEIEDKMHTETSIIGFHLLDPQTFEETTFEELTKSIQPDVPNGVNNCAICGKKLVRSHGFHDVREMDGGLRCFDHIGVELK